MVAVICWLIIKSNYESAANWQENDSTAIMHIQIDELIENTMPPAAHRMHGEGIKLY